MIKLIPHIHLVLLMKTSIISLQITVYLFIYSLRSMFLNSVVCMRSDTQQNLKEVLPVFRVA